MRPTELRSFSDRTHAGRDLARALREYNWQHPVVLGLARGGVTVAAAVANELEAPLDVAVARKIGAPAQPEFGIGATTANHEATYDEASLRRIGLNQADLAGAAAEQQAEAQRMLALYQGDREPEPRAGHDLIIVDDGLATGVTANAALHAERVAQPRSITLAAPVAAPEAAEALGREVDLMIYLAAPEPFGSVGQWYREFNQVSDDEVVATLEAAHQRTYGPD